MAAVKTINPNIAHFNLSIKLEVVFTQQEDSRHGEHIGAACERCGVLKLHVLVLQVLQFALHELPQAPKHLLLSDVALVALFDLQFVSLLPVSH